MADIDTTEPRGEARPPDRAEDLAWSEARKRVQAKRDFGTHLVAYVVVNAVLVGLWLTTGQGYFWPVWVIGGWGIGLALHGWEAYGRRPITDADIEAELRRRR